MSRFVIIPLLVCFLWLAPAVAKDPDLPVTDLPKTIVEAAKAGFPDAKIASATRRTKLGKITLYTLKAHAKTDIFDVLVDADSAAILSVGVRVSVKKLPSLIQDTIIRDFGHYKISEGVRLTDYKTKNVTYSVELTKLAAKPLLVELTPAGKLVLQQELEP